MQKHIILILIVFFGGCANNQNKNSRYSEEQIASLQLDSTRILQTETDSLITVDLNPFLKEQSFDFGSMVKEVKLVPLETTDESLVADITKVLATDSHIYIYDTYKGGGLIIFDREGKFIRRISHGGGPGELARLYDIAFDSENNRLVAYQHSFLLFFTASGQFIRKVRLPIGFYNFTVIPGGYVFKALNRQGNGHLGQLEDYTLFVTDTNFKMKSVAMPILARDINYDGYNYLYKNNNELKITQKLTDTVYQYMSGTDQLKARYVMDYSKKKLPEHYSQGSYEEFKNAAVQNDYYFYIGEYLETESHNVFVLMNFYTTFQLIVYRDKKTGNLMGGTSAEYKITEIPSIAFPISASGNYFITAYLPSKNDLFLSESSIISDEDKIKIKNLMEDDNPVLAFFTLKDF